MAMVVCKNMFEQSLAPSYEIFQKVSVIYDIHFVSSSDDNNTANLFCRKSQNKIFNKVLIMKNRHMISDLPLYLSPYIKDLCHDEIKRAKT